jgi:hypothetical protein
MHFEITADPSEMLALHRRFVTITGWEPWEKRLVALGQQVKENPLLKGHFAERYALELEMGKLHRNVRLGRKIKLPKTYQAYALLSFIAMIARTYDRLGAEGQRRLAGMLRSALDDEYGLAPVQHEMNVAAHLMSKGFDVTFSDIESGGGFDMLAVREGVEIEVECKTHSADIGRKIHRRRLYQLGGCMLSKLESALARRDGGQLAQIKLPKRLDGIDRHLRDISECLDSVLREGISFAGPEPCAIEYRTFSLTGGPFGTTNPSGLEMEVARQYLQEEIGHPIGDALTLFRPSYGAVVVTVESAQPDRVIDGLVRQLKRLAKRQLTGTRPGLICVRFSDITEDELLELAEGDKAGGASSLQRATSMLLNRPDWRNVHTLAYVVPGHLNASTSENEHIRTQTLQGTGPSYSFTNPHHQLASDPGLRIL